MAIANWSFCYSEAAEHLVALGQSVVAPVHSPYSNTQSAKEELVHESYPIAVCSCADSAVLHHTSLAHVQTVGTRLFCPPLALQN